VSRLTRVKLMILVPMTMALLVWATGIFTKNMTERVYVIHGPFGPELDAALGQIGLQVGLIALIAATLGLGIAVGVTSPLREFANRLEAVASGDLRGAIEMRSASEVDWLAGAFNDAISAINRYVFQSMTGAVMTLSNEGIVIGSSPAAEVILGYREDEVVGRRFSDVFAPVGSGRASLSAIETAIAKRQAVNMRDVWIVAKDGRPIKIGISVSYLRRGGPNGEAGTEDEAIGVTIAFKDLTEIRQLRERLQQADQLVALGTLTAGVAHELRNPLASLQGLAELLSRDFNDTDPRRRYTGAMMESIERLNKLVEDLLLLSSSGAPVSDEVDLDRVAEDVVSTARVALGDKRVTVAIDERAATTPVVLGSRHRLHQALSNIVRNAVQASPEHGAVTVRVSTTDMRAIVAVHNTGSFIPPDRMKQLFTPFFTTKPTGTGLGLAIARQIVTAHGGRIEVASDASLGTTFTLNLPLADETASGLEPGHVAEWSGAGPAVLDN
jgi:two-component system sensor histidine kinase AtoS